MCFNYSYYYTRVPTVLLLGSNVSICLCTFILKINIHIFLIIQIYGTLMEITNPTIDISVKKKDI